MTKGVTKKNASNASDASDKNSAGVQFEYDRLGLIVLLNFFMLLVY